MTLRPPNRASQYSPRMINAFAASATCGVRTSEVTSDLTSDFTSDLTSEVGGEAVFGAARDASVGGTRRRSFGRETVRGRKSDRPPDGRRDEVGRFFTMRMLIQQSVGADFRVLVAIEPRSPRYEREIGPLVEHRNQRLVPIAEEALSVHDEVAGAARAQRGKR